MGQLFPGPPSLSAGADSFAALVVPVPVRSDSGIAPLMPGPVAAAPLPEPPSTALRLRAVPKPRLQGYAYRLDHQEGKGRLTRHYPHDESWIVNWELITEQEAPRP